MNLRRRGSNNLVLRARFWVIGNIRVRSASRSMNRSCMGWRALGRSASDRNEFAAARIKQFGAKSAFLGYRKYPCQICISVNEQVVHGLAGPRTLRFGDIVSLDVGVLYNGFIGDTARTVAVGGCDVAAQKLMDVGEKALCEGIAKAVAGKRVVDISRAIQNHVEGNGFSVVREFVGHGVGRTRHRQ